jgi:tetratricopeptide (TPR) repeat protein
VKLWDAESGQELLMLRGHESWAAGSSFSPDGTRIASAMDDMVRIWDGREPTPESLAREEAWNLVSFLVDRLASEGQVRERVARDRTRSPAVRAAALELVHSLWETRINGRAEGFVRPLFRELMLRDDVLDALRRRPAADPEVQAACLRIAEATADSAWECKEAAARLILRPGQPPASYERGLRLARAATALEPDNGNFVNSLGIAEYRVGLLPEALATLQRSNEMQRGKEPEDLAFLAMTYQRLGHPAEAREILGRLRDVSRQTSFPHITVDNVHALLAEAEAMVLYDPIFPDDPFSR